MEKIQRKATKMIPELRNLSYERRLQRLELISLEQRTLRGQLIETFKYLNDLNNVTLEGLFERDGNVRTRNNGQKLLLRNFKTSQAMNSSYFRRHGTSVLNQEWAKRLVPIALFYSILFYSLFDKKSGTSRRRYR
ncbi:hypothetical protein FHG87_020451 [Trinorchestia longiramus]|nr:hypothetical protein FHG87_020451 [Trinorchestia longiramus]